MTVTPFPRSRAALVDAAVREALRPGKFGGVGRTFLWRYREGRPSAWALKRVASVWNTQRLDEAIEGMHKRIADGGLY